MVAHGADAHDDERRAMRHLMAVVAGTIPARLLVPVLVVVWLGLAFAAWRLPEPWSIIPAAGLFVVTFVAGAWAALMYQRPR